MQKAIQGIDVEFVGSANTRIQGDPVTLFRKQGLPVLRKALQDANLHLTPRRVLLTGMFRKAANRIPEWSGITVAEHGVNFRIQAERTSEGFLGMLLCIEGETPSSLAEALLDPKAEALPADDPSTVAKAVEFTAALAAAPSDSLASFASLVAVKAGKESKDYWMEALCTAEKEGLLVRTSRRFALAKVGPVAPTMVDPSGKLLDPVTGGELRRTKDLPVPPLLEDAISKVVDFALATPAPAQARKAKISDDDIAEDAGKLLETLTLLKDLTAIRKALTVEETELTGSLARVKDRLHDVGAKIRKAKSDLDADALLRLAESAESSRSGA